MTNNNNNNNNKNNNNINNNNNNNNNVNTTKKGFLRSNKFNTNSNYICDLFYLIADNSFITLTTCHIFQLLIMASHY